MAEELNSSFADYFRQVFQAFDEDGNMQMTKQQLRLLMGAIGENLSETKIDDLINQIDKDSNGSIDSDEFLHLMQIIMKRSDPKQECRKAFRIFDRDGNGTISASELRQVMKNLERPMTASELEQLYKKFGKEGIEEIDEQNFIKLMMESSNNENQ